MADYDSTRIRVGPSRRIVPGQVSARIVMIELHRYLAETPARPVGVKITRESAAVRIGRHGWMLIWSGSRR